MILRLSETMENLSAAVSEIEQLTAENTDLRRQLAELRNLLSDAAHADLDRVADKINSDLIVEVDSLRRQLAEAKAPEWQPIEGDGFVCGDDRVSVYKAGSRLIIRHGRTGREMSADILYPYIYALCRKRKSTRT